MRNCENDTKEDLDFKDRVIKMNAGFGYLIVITPTQCYIYRYLYLLVILFTGSDVEVVMLQPPAEANLARE